jgi:hypothetical protein
VFCGWLVAVVGFCIFVEVSVSVYVVLCCYKYCYLSGVMVVVVIISFISGDHWLWYVFVVENVLQLQTCCHHQSQSFFYLLVVLLLFPVLYKLRVVIQPEASIV